MVDRGQLEGALVVAQRKLVVVLARGGVVVGVEVEVVAPVLGGVVEPVVVVAQA